VKLLNYAHPERSETTELAKLVADLTTQINELVKGIDNPPAWPRNNLLILVLNLLGISFVIVAGNPDT